MNVYSKNFDSNWLVSCEWEDGATYITFLITNASNDEALHGSIKWDGCSNWSQGGHHYFHLCGIKDLANLTECLGFCYDFAQSKMPEAYG